MLCGIFGGKKLSSTVAENAQEEIMCVMTLGQLVAYIALVTFTY